jgi:hypothetical protein
MINNGKNPDWAEVIRNNKRLSEHHQTRGPYSCCGHDFWEEAKKLTFGDVVLCNRCHTYYAIIKHLPWVVEGHNVSETYSLPPHTNHLSDRFLMPLTARVTD